MNYYTISALINAATSLILGIFVFSKNRKSKTNIGIALFALSTACWSIFYYLWQISTTSEAALFCSRALMAGAIFIPITYLHFVFALLGIFDKRRKFLIFSYFLFFIFFLLNFIQQLFFSDLKKILLLIILILRKHENNFMI